MEVGFSLATGVRRLCVFQSKYLVVPVVCH